jgi:hypothetical protein
MRGLFFAFLAQIERVMSLASHRPSIRPPRVLGCSSRDETVHTTSVRNKGQWDLRSGRVKEAYTARTKAKAVPLYEL